MTKKVDLPTPSQIKSYLDKYVIGQDEAKRVLAIAVYNHYKRLNYKSYDDTVIEKSNIILHGHTGCGKTMLVKTIARLLDVPCYIQDCTKITASGYVGDDVENCIVGLLRECNYNISKAQKGIVVLDECDKIAKKEAGLSVTRDVSGECVQQSLLKIVEGDIVGVQPSGGRKHPDAQQLYINTKDILFIACGAFVGLDEIVRKKAGRKRVGFKTSPAKTTTIENQRRQITPEDFQKFGFIPEFIGRFPVITYVDKLSEADLLKILKEPKNSIVSQYKALMAMDNAELNFTDEALAEIAHCAYLSGTGARSLRGVFEKVMMDVMYTVPDETRKSRKKKSVMIDREYVRNVIQSLSGNPSPAGLPGVKFSVSHTEKITG